MIKIYKILINLFIIIILFLNIKNSITFYDFLNFNYVIIMSNLLNLPNNILDILIDSLIEFKYTLNNNLINKDEIIETEIVDEINKNPNYKKICFIGGMIICIGLIYLYYNSTSSNFSNFDNLKLSEENLISKLLEENAKLIKENTEISTKYAEQMEKLLEILE
jgi:hypothetical protein